MKIAFIGHKRIPSREGGIEVVVHELATRMRDEGNHVVAYSRKGHNVAGTEFDDAVNALSEPYVHKGVHVVPVRTIDAKGLAALSSSFFATLRALRARPDVIHYHAEGPCVPLRLAYWSGIRTVATIHGLDWQRAKWGRFASAYLKFGERTAAKYADEVIVLSRNMQDYFKKTYGRNVRVIPNGVKQSTATPPKLIAERHGLRKDGYVLFLGRVVPEKGVHYLLEAFRGVDTDKKLVIAGGPSDSREYYESVKREAAKDDRVVMTGFVEGEMLEELYSNAYVYVLPSDLEGMPMSLLEAMSHGNCCLTSDIPECVEVLDGHGVCFRQGDAEDLREKLAALIAQPDRVAGFRRKAADHVAARYSWDTVVRRTLDLYRGAGGRRDRRNRRVRKEAA